MKTINILIPLFRQKSEFLSYKRSEFLNANWRYVYSNVYNSQINKTSFFMYLDSDEFNYSNEYITIHLSDDEYSFFKLKIS